MSKGYGFLKYGKPLAAAAPILLGLSAMPGPAHACTGSANDPAFCAQLGQFIAELNTFLVANIVGVPGTNPIPGSTLPAEFFVNLERLVEFQRDQEDYRNAFTNNATVIGGAPVFTPYVAGTPQLPGETRTYSPQNWHQYYSASGYSAPPAEEVQQYGEGLPEAYIKFVTSKGSIPYNFSYIIDADPDTEFTPGSCSQGSPAACSETLGPLILTLTETVDPENIPVIMAGIPLDDDDAGDSVFEWTKNMDKLFGSDDFEEVPDTLTEALVEALSEEFGYAPNDDDDGGPAVDTSEDDFFLEFNDDDDDVPVVIPAENVTQKLGSGLDRLRDRAQNETDPEKKAELEARVERFERLARTFGSAALQSGLSNQDAQSAPRVGRN